MGEHAISVHLEFTPNPNTLKFVVNRDLVERGTANFTHAEQAEHSPLAKKLFAIPGIEAVMIGRNFITLTKATLGDWDVVADKAPQTIEEHLGAGLPVFDSEWKWPEVKLSGDETEIERKIKEILDTEIRPAVAMDGGDITFGRYEDGVVYLHLQGSCSSCPSAVATLRMGVETRLREFIPEIKEVVQV